MNAVFWMLGTLASFSLMAIGVRELSGEISVFQTLFCRSVIGLLCITVIIFVAKHNAPSSHVKTERLGLHFFRNVFHFGGQFGWYWGIGLLPLAEVFALEFTVPIWTLLIATLFLGENLTGRKLLSMTLGLVGVLVIVKPGLAIVDPASLVVLGAAICYAVSHSTTKSLSQSESPITILFYMCLIQLPIGLLLAWNEMIWPTMIQWVWLIIIGGTALTAHFCMTKALQRAEVSLVVTMDFLRLPFIAMMGVLLYSESFQISLLVGGLLMLLGNLIAVGPFRRSRRRSRLG